ncbi:MAG TPA: DinB family protein, partial [Candidatus Kapabacteria bacterium]|nr:DinB family protein [Candidatus Kapabacteria bacterium]
MKAMSEQRVTTMQVLDAIEEEDYLIAEAFGKWSLRDLVAHMIGWERLTFERNELIKQGLEPDAVSCDDADAINDTFVHTIDTRSKKELLRQFQDVRADLVASLRSLSEEHYVNDVGRLPSVQKRLPGCTFEHEREHLAKVIAWVASKDEELDSATGAESKIVMASRALPWMRHPKKAVSAAEKNVELEALQEELADFPIAVQRIETAEGTEKLVRTSATPHDNPVPTPPFWGSRVVEDIKIEKVWEYLNEV